jgi:limonene-1,2-epoxide hydrolase
VEAIAVLRAFATALEHGDVEAAAACFALDATYDEPPRFHFEGRAAIAAFIRDFAASHTYVYFEIVRTLASPDGAELAAEWRFGHTRGSDGARASYAGMSFITLTGGRIFSWRGYSAVG